MRYVCLLMTLLLGISCADLTRPAVSPQYLRCAASTATGSDGDTGISGSDQTLFGGMTRHFLNGEAQPRYSAARRDATPRAPPLPL